MAIGYVEMNDNQMLQSKLMKLFQLKKSVPYIKYSNFSKLFIIPKGLLTEKWSMPFKNQVKKILGVSSEIVWLILFNKSKQNDTNLLDMQTTLVNPIPIKQINWKNGPIEIDENSQGLDSKMALEALTPVSSDDEFSNQPVQHQKMTKSNFGSVLNKISNMGETNYDKNNYENKNNHLFNNDSNLLSFLKQGQSYNEPEKFAVNKNDYANQQPKSYYNPNNMMKDNSLLHSG